MRNVDQINFLVNSFTELVHNFGENTKTIEYFRNNIDGLVRIGQLHSDEANLIFRIIGMENTNAVKWSITNDKVAQFSNALATILKNPIWTANSVNTLINNFRSNGYISQSVADLLKETFGIISTPVTSTKTVTDTHNYDVDDYKKQIDQFMDIFRKYANYTIMIEKDMYHCAGQDKWDVYSVGSLVKNLVGVDPITRIIRGSEFKVGKFSKSTGCDGRRTFNKDNYVTDQFKLINWELVMERAKMGP